MTLINDVVTALNTINPQTHVSLLEDMLELAIAEGISPLAVIGHRYHNREPFLHQIVTQEMYVIHALASQNIEIVSEYLTSRSVQFASPSCINTDKSLPVVWYAQALVEQYKQKPTAEKWQWLSKVIRRNLLEDTCPKSAFPYEEKETVHLHIYASEPDVIAHPQSKGVYVCVSPTQVYTVTPSETLKFSDQKLITRIQEVVEKMKPPRLSMQTIAEEEQTYNIHVVKGGHELYEAAVATTLSGTFKLIGCAPMTDATTPTSFIPQIRQTEAIFLYAFDSSGKGVYDFRQPQSPFSAVSVSIVDP